MKVFSDILSFLKTLNFVDIVFFFAVLILMILIVTLIYFITINNEEKSDEKEETAEMKIIKEIQENINKETPEINFTNYETNFLLWDKMVIFSLILTYTKDL